MRYIPLLFVLLLSSCTTYYVVYYPQEPCVQKPCELIHWGGEITDPTWDWGLMTPVHNTPTYPSGIWIDLNGDTTKQN